MQFAARYAIVPATMTTQTAIPAIDADLTMRELLQAFPGAQRALFRKYHIGGCSSCGFQPTETLAQVCERNERLPVSEVIDHIQSSHEADLKMQITPAELDAKLKAGGS